MTDSKQIDRDMVLKDEFDKRSSKIQRVVRDGIQFTVNASFDKSKEDEDVLHAFPDLEEIDARAKDADRIFGEVMLKTMECKQLPQPLYQLLEEQKSEAQTILKKYDDIIQQLNSILGKKEKEYRMKIEKQSIQHQIIRERIEEIIEELNRVGKEEISAIRSAIVDHSQNISDNLSIDSGEMLGQNIADNVFDSHFWKESSKMLTLQQMEDAFLIHHKDTFILRSNLLCEVCKLRNELEKEKLNYNLKKQEFEQEIFYLGEKYHAGIPMLSNMKRKCIKLNDKKNQLCNELKEINELIEKERLIKDKQCFHTQELEIRYAREEQSFKYQKVFAERKVDACTLHLKILVDVAFIFKNILQLPDLSPDLITPNMDTSGLRQKDWNCFLCTILEEPLIDEILSLMEEYWNEWKTCAALKENKKSLASKCKHYNNFLKLYKKYKSI